MRTLQKWMILLSVTWAAAAFVSQAPVARASTGMSTADISTAYGKAVVLVETEGRVGTGFIISGDGLVVSAYHVVGKNASGTIRLQGGKTYWIREVVHTDSLHDVAVLRVDGSGLPAVRLGNSDNIRVGERVVAIGSPFGLENTVSEGIISAVRTVPTDEGDVKIIQTSAPVSPGNSGGPLFNSSGEVIGIVIFQLVRGQNLNFAIPINYVQRNLPLKGPPAADVSRPQGGYGRPAGEQGYVIHLRDGRTIEVKEYWEQGQEIKYRRYGGVLGVNRKQIAMIENQGDGTKVEYNPFFTKQEIDQRRKIQERRLERDVAREQKEQELWEREALHGNIIAEAVVIHKMYSPTVMMGLSPEELERLVYSWDRLGRKLEYRARHGVSAIDRSQARDALLLMLDQMARVNEVLALRRRGY